MKPDLTVVILTFNVKDLTRNCLQSLFDSKYPMKIIVTDNDSQDGTVEVVKKEFPSVVVLDNKKNLGFAKGNNTAKKYCGGEFVLILNPDTVVEKNTISECIRFLKEHKNYAAVTCKMVLANGDLDLDARRSFPTPFTALTHFMYLDRLFPKSRIFAKYWYGFKSAEETHDIDVPQGAFFLVRKNIMDKVGWYDEDYFLDGEDIDIAYRIHKLGYKIAYYPKVQITHYKGASKGKKVSGFQGVVSAQNRKRAVSSGVESMKIFYKKHYAKKYPKILTALVLLGIDSIKLLRTVKNFWSFWQAKRVQNQILESSLRSSPE